MFMKLHPMIYLGFNTVYSKIDKRCIQTQRNYLDIKSGSFLRHLILFFLYFLWFTQKINLLHGITNIRVISYM